MNNTQLTATIDQTKLLKKLGVAPPGHKPHQIADTYHLPELLLLVIEALPPTVRLCYTPPPAPDQDCAFSLLTVPPNPPRPRSTFASYSPGTALASLFIDLLKYPPQPATATPSNG